MPDKVVRRVLHIEQNVADIEIVREFLEDDPASPEVYHVDHVGELDDAIGKLQSDLYDAVLLHLRLAAEGVAAVRKTAAQVPVIVITGFDDETRGLEAIDSGAQDYLFKNDLTARGLRRAIGYAISRKREAEVRVLGETLTRFRELASEASTTSVTARAMGVGPLKDSTPELFDEAVGFYARLMKRYVMAPRSEHTEPRDGMERLITRLGDMGAGPKDMIDLHASALEEVSHTERKAETNIMIVEGRLFALEMMGLLVNYYRLGHRRLTWGR